MTKREAAQLDEEEPSGSSPLLRWGGVALLGLAVLFLSGVLAGFVSAQLDRGGGAFSARAVAILAAVAAALGACIWLIVRAVRRRPRGEPLTKKERRNLYVLIGSAVLGGVLAVVTTAAGGDSLEGASVFSSSPLPFGIALGVVLVLGLLVPAMSIYWHRSIVDEQESDAYKTGALYGLYVYMIGAPVWWFAWRGGFAPEPNGIIIFFATIFTVGVIWISKKYG